MSENRRVNFINTETGDDMTLSFALQHLGDPSGIQSLVMQRTPKYEFILKESERGVHVSLEGHHEDAYDCLLSFVYERSAKRVLLKTTRADYELDVRSVDDDDLKEMTEVIREMNFDNRFQIFGA